MGERSLLDLLGPIRIVGDLHGQFHDLLRIIERTGFPDLDMDKITPMLFLGDYVDRGCNSIEVIAMLFLLKVSYPHHFWLLRGNHETRTVNAVHGLRDECIARFGGDAAWRMLNAAFDWLPAAAVVGGRIFCVHGGVSSRMSSLEQVRSISRPIDPQGGTTADHVVLNDLLWSDPTRACAGWMKNCGRGGGMRFGTAALSAFCDAFDLAMLVRAHEAVDGFDFPFGDESCLTVFSAPDYQRTGNLGASLLVARNLTCRLELIFPKAFEDERERLWSED